MNNNGSGKGIKTCRNEWIRGFSLVDKPLVQSLLPMRTGTDLNSYEQKLIAGLSLTGWYIAEVLQGTKKKRNVIIK